jgi:hypothetical protein
MGDASEAGRALSRARWGTTKVDRLVHELAERREDLRPTQVKALRLIVTDATEDERDGQ